MEELKFISNSKLKENTELDPTLFNVPKKIYPLTLCKPISQYQAEIHRGNDKLCLKLTERPQAVSVLKESQKQYHLGNLDEKGIPQLNWA